VYAIPDMHDKYAVPAVTNVTFATGGTGGADLVMTFKVTLDGVAKTDLTAMSRDARFYIDANGDGQLRDLSTDGTAATLSGGTGGNYTITIANGAATYGTVNSRYEFRLATATYSTATRLMDPRVTVVGDWPASPQTPDMVTAQTCANCHGPSRNDEPHNASPMNGLNCTVCHDAVNSAGGEPDANYMTMVHGIHNSEQMPGGEWVAAIGTFKVAYPTYMSNCSVCHSTPAALAKANAMTVSGKNCFSCHGDITSWEEGFAAAGVSFHITLGYDETTDCTVCHSSAPDAAAPGLVKVTDFHNGLETGNVGIIEDGVDTSITLGKKFTWTINSVADNTPAGKITITWSATYDSGSGPVAVDPCNTTIDATHPGFVPSTAMMDAGTFDGQPGMLLTFMQGNDYVLGQATSEPGQPVNTNIITSTGGKTSTSTSAVNTTCAGNVATTTINRGTVPAGVTVGIVALQGKPMLPLPSNVDTADYPYASMYVRVPTPDFQFNVGATGTQTTETTDVRRTIVDVDKCKSCHVGSLYQHGNTRVDNTLMCTVCHNSASSEQSVRYGMGIVTSTGAVDTTKTYDGLVGQTFELKTLLHRIHTAGEQFEATPLVIYRNRGIYAWAPEGTVIPNWPTSASTPCGTGEGGVNKYPVYGSPTTNANYCQPFNLFAPTYPRYMFDCTACHTTGSVNNTPNQSEAVATTLDAGSTVWQNQIDDTLQGASAAACTTCHTSTDAKGHAYQEGWTPQTFPNGRQTIIDTK
jgi:OmcA/MtrC family decaheme c-type cytochrome